MAILRPPCSWLWIYTALILVMIGVGLQWLKLPDGKLHFSMIDVGQGDGLFLQTPSGKQIVMDAGPDLSILTGLGDRMPWTDRSIDLLILSHPHFDHLGAFPEILRRYHVGAVMLAGMKYPGARYQELLDEIARHHVPVIIPDPQKDIDLGDGVVLDVLWPKPLWFGKSVPGDDVHSAGVALRALFRDQSLVLTGDIETPTEMAILQSGADVRGTVLKVAHHGSKTSTSTGFLLAVDPKVALISAGRNNKFHHPNQETLDRLEHFKIPIHVTKDEGSIDLEW